LPGETALIAFGVLAAAGNYSIGVVIGVAAAAAIIGDNLGYWLIGRVGGRRLLARWPWLARHLRGPLTRAEAFMRRHGPAAVFLGRFVSVLRYTVAWVAGMASIRWTTFLFWDAAGGISWAVAVGLASFYGGKAIGGAIGRYALGLAGLAVLLWLGRFAVRRLHRSR
jgi:membrane protein DedA with SNARE-associated domain